MAGLDTQIPDGSIGEQLDSAPKGVPGSFGQGRSNNMSARSQDAAGAPTSFSGNLDVVMKIPVSVKVVLGSTSMPVASLLKLGRGAVIPLDRRVGDPVEVVVNDHVVARGEVVVINEDGSRFGISLTEIIGMQAVDKGNAS